MKLKLRRRRIGELPSDTGGTALIEFAWAAVGLLFLAVGIMEIGRATMMHHSLTEGVREYQDVGEITAEFPEMVPALQALSVTSDHFEIQIRAQVDDSLVEMASVLHRDPENGTIRVVMRDLGKPFQTLFAEVGEEES